MLVVYPFGEWSSAPQTTPCVITSCVALSLPPRILTQGVPLFIFVLMVPHVKHIKRLGYAMKQQDSQRQTTTTVSELSKIRGQRQSIVSLSQKYMYLVAKFEDFHPSCWWMSVFLLVLRLLQTSMMVLFVDQHSQVHLHH
jgi:hypothetical protein